MLNTVYVFNYYATAWYIVVSFLVDHIDVITLCPNILYHDSFLASEDIGFLYRMFPPRPLFRPPPGSELSLSQNLCEHYPSHFDIMKVLSWNIQGIKKPQALQNYFF